MNRFSIKHPEWLAEERLFRVYRLYRRNQIPTSIDGWMLAIPLIHELRAIFGSNSAIVWYLICHVCDRWWNLCWQRICCVLYLAPWFLAKAWTFTWGGARWLRYREPYAYMWGRHDSPDPVKCEECAWRGPRRWAVHSYQDDGSGEDVEASDECPRCGAEV